MRQSILVGELVCTSISDDILAVVHINPVQSDWWWASPSHFWLVGMVSKMTNDWLLSHSEVSSLPLGSRIYLRKKNIDTTNRQASVMLDDINEQSRWQQ